MCGIVGFITQGEARESVAEMLDEALTEDTKRGDGATGVMWREMDGRLMVKKGQGTPDKAFGKWPLPTSPLMVGHNRAPTIGHPMYAENNHPVVSGGLSLVHNGVVEMEKDHKEKLKLEPEAEVDSHLIVQAIRLCMGKDHDVPKAVVEASKYLTGGMACVVMDADFPTKVWMFKRGRYPMELVYVPSLSTIFFGSEASTLLLPMAEHVGVLGGLFRTLKYPKHFTCGLSDRQLLELDSSKENFGWKVTTLPEEPAKSWSGYGVKMWHNGRAIDPKETWCQKCRDWHYPEMDCRTAAMHSEYYDSP